MTEPLPSGWAWSTVGEVFKIVGGSTPRTDNPDYWDGDISWITPDDLSRHKGAFVSEGCRSITTEGFESTSTQMLPQDSVLFSSRAPIGYVAIAANSLCTNQGFKSLIPPVGIQSKYVYWYLRYATPTIQDMGSGTTFKEISKKRMAIVPFLLPPTNEQGRIVAAVEEHLSRIDAAESAAQTALVRLDTLSRAILTAAFSGHLVDQDPDDEPASILLERIAAERPQRQTRYAAHGANQGPYSESKKLPPGWKWATVGELSTFVRGVTFKKSDASSELSSGLVPIARAGNVESGRSKLDQDLVYVPKERVAIDQYLRTGDILVATSSGSPKVVGKSAIISEDWQGAHGAFMGVIRSNPDICSAYLGFYVQSECVRLMWRELAAGTNINNLKRDDIIATTVPLPPVAEQKRIVAAIEMCFTRIDTVKASLERCLQRCGVLRQTVLAAAFSGRLVEQDPSDEPASVLLERIAAEQPKRRTRRKSA